MEIWSSNTRSTRYQSFGSNLSSQSRSIPICLAFSWVFIKGGVHSPCFCTMFDRWWHSPPLCCYSCQGRRETAREPMDLFTGKAQAFESYWQSLPVKALLNCRCLIAEETHMHMGTHTHKHSCTHACTHIHKHINTQV